MSVHVGYTVTDNTVPQGDSGPSTLRLTQSCTPTKSLQITHADRAEFLSFMRAWSWSVLPGPNLWWVRAVLYVAQWRRRDEAGSQ